MKENFKKYVPIGLVVIWMIVIFGFSAMNGKESNIKSKEVIHKIVTQVIIITNKLNITHIDTHEEHLKEIVNNLNFILRKCMHASVYFILSMIIFHLVRTNNLSVFRAFLIASLFSFVYACTDEYHQTFIDGRTGQFSDVLIDTAGVLVGGALCSILESIKKHIKNKPNSKDE